MKPSHRKLLGFVILLLFVLPLGLSVAQAFREGRQQALNRALIAAIKNNDAKAVITALAKGANPNARDLQPDHRSAWQRLWDSLQRKRLQTDDAPTALLVALEMHLDVNLVKYQDVFPPENVPLVTALLDAGATANVAESNGTTPLMWAAMSKKRETVRLLLDRGAEINTRDTNGCNALYCTAPENDPALVRLLLAHGAQVNVTGIEGSPLAQAAAGGQAVSIRILLDSGAKVNSRDLTGETPLYRAVRRNHADCVKLLIARGAQVNAKDDGGNTPLSMAQFYGYQEIANMLKKAGAKK
jgi:ankyrin repeat protein